MTIFTGNQEIISLIHQVHAALPPKTKAYLVGGAVRDFVTGREVHDLDFILISAGRVIPIARRIADDLSADFFPLDKERDTARLIFHLNYKQRIFLDFASLRDIGLAEDLAARDFTINAMAIDLDQDDVLIDPLHGINDIHRKILNVCSDNSFLSDPLRILRAVRLAVQLDFRLSPEALKLIRQALFHLQQVSPERLRDEIFRMLNNRRMDTILRIMEKLGILQFVFPEIVDLIGVQQSSPHILDAWNHTLSVVQKLEQILWVLGLESDLEESGNIVSSWVSMRLGRYREQFAEHFSVNLNPERSIQSLLVLAAIYHDAGKAATKSVGAKGEIHFYGHEQVSKDLLIKRAEFLRLSGQEIDRLGTIVGGHLRPLMLNQSSESPSKRSVYKFWRDLDEAGVDVCLLSIADLLGAYGSSIPIEVLSSQLTTVRDLLEAWWDQRQVLVSPPALLNGNQLMQEFDLKPGPMIGEILESLRQAQVEGSVSNRQQALDHVHRWLSNPQSEN